MLSAGGHSYFSQQQPAGQQHYQCQQQSYSTTTQRQRVNRLMGMAYSNNNHSHNSNDSTNNNIPIIQQQQSTHSINIEQQPLQQQPSINNRIRYEQQGENIFRSTFVDLKLRKFRHRMF